jgi:hypothetical protein
VTQICEMKIRLILISFIVLGLSRSVAAQVSNPALRDELLAMEKVDQEERVKCTAGDADFQIQCLKKLSETIDAVNTKRLEEIFDQYGFPDTAKVGKEGLRAFMVLLQHTTTDKLREKSIKPITKAFKRRELTSQDYANFIDRFRLHQGKPQIYGSGFETKDGKLVLSKTEGLKDLDKRRKKIGLPPMSEHVEMLKSIYKLEVEMPSIN